ncbi:MAG TPA: SRPBCC family protein [Acidimicrobiia bacterium]
MTQITTRAEFGVDRKEAFEFLTDPHNWDLFYSNLTGLVGDEPQTLAKRGDTVNFHYSILGRRVQANAVAQEVVYGEKVLLTVSIPGLPDVHQEWTYSDTPDGFAAEVTMNTEEATSFLGKAVDRFVVPRALQRDLEKTLENMKQMFSIGIPAADN